MKTQKIVIKAVSFLFILLSLFAIVNCSKNNSRVVPSNDSGDEIVEESIVNNIHSFLEKSALAREGGVLKSSTEITVDSAKFLVGSTINYTYGYATSGYQRSIWDTLYVGIPVNFGTGMVYYDAAVSAYNECVDSLISLYRAIEDTTKIFVGISMEDLGTNGSLQRELLIIAHFGTGGCKLSILNQNGLFNFDDEYWYRDNSYNCLEQGNLGAPDILEREILFKFLPAPVPGYHVWFESETTDFEPDYNIFQGDGNIDNYCDYFIFYANSNVGTIDNNTKCLGYNQQGFGISEMDYYLDCADSITRYGLEEENPYDYSFYTCSIISHNPTINGVEILEHDFGFKFAKKHLSPNPVGGGIYPIPIAD